MSAAECRAVARRVTNLEAEATRLSKLAVFEFSPRDAAFYRGRAQDLMAQAAALRTAELGHATGDHSACDQWMLHVGRDADRWYGDRAAARMAGAR